MRAFVILCCVATAYAASLGYDYDRNNAAPAGGDGGALSGGAIGSPFGGFDGGNQAGPADFGGPAGAGPGGVGGGPAEYTKEFFTYSAPEQEFNDDAGQNQLADSLKKSLRVVFIKGPENNGLENAALQLAKSAGDDRTAIYVLNKQADISDLANKLQSLQHSNANRPEVHFVKYRTPADAENAQRAIQSQYNNFGGPSSSHDGGVAPVLNFASKAPAPVAPQSGGYGGSFGARVQSSSAYLPPHKRF